MFLSLNQLSKILPIILFISLTQCVLAQQEIQQEKQKTQQEMQDILALKNGQTIKGKILEQTKEFIKIKMYGGSELTFNLNEIEEVTQEPFKHIKSKPRFKVKKRGYFNYSTCNLYNSDRYKLLNPFNIQVINGYRFKPNLEIGLGMGINSYNIWNGLNITAWSMYLNLSGDFSKKDRLTKTYAIDFGTGSSWTYLEEHPNKIAIYYAFSLGLKHRSSKNFKWVCSLRFTTQYLQRTDRDSETYEIIFILKRYTVLSINTGFYF